MSILKLLILVGKANVIVVRIFLVIGKQMILVAGKNNNIPYKKSFIQNILKIVIKYL